MANICIYCGRPGSSKEHVWPKWVRTHALKVMNIKIANFQSYSGTHDRVGRDPVSIMRKEGHSRLSLTIRHACQECNTGWMSNLEEVAIPIVKPMIEGKKTRLTLDETKILRAWATKTALHFILDGEESFGKLIPPGFAHDLYRGRHSYEPVPNVQVWTAFYNPLAAFQYRHMSALGYGEYLPTHVEHFVLRSVFIAGHVIFYVRLPDSPVAQELYWRDPLPQFVPLHEPFSTHRISWRNGSVNDTDISETFNRHIHAGIYPGEENHVWRPLT